MKSWFKIAAGLVLAVLLGAVMMVGAPAGATGTKPAPVCADWAMRGATGAYPDVTFGGAPEGSVVRRGSARLTKPSGEDAVQPGVEFAVKTLDIEVETETTVSVRFELGGDASPQAGAVRLFGYAAKGADTLLDGPDYRAVAETRAGTMAFTIPAGGKLGTLGAAYDASNDSAGSVTVRDMRLGDRPVWFKPCPKPEQSQSSSPAPSVTTTSPAGDPTTTSPASPAPGGTTGTPAPEDPETLPVTGPGGPLLAGGAVALLAAGGVLLWAVRRRRVSFKA